jgi:type IV pilus assembly protein PilB
VNRSRRRAPEPVERAQAAATFGADLARPPVVRTGPPLGERLIARGLLTEPQLAEALLQQPASGKLLGVLLAELGVVDERAVAECLAEQLDVPLVDLRQDAPERDSVVLLPEDLARTLDAIPIGDVEGDVLVAVADPADESVRAKIAEVLAPRRVRLGIASRSDIRRSVNASYRVLAGAEPLVTAFEATETLRRVVAAPRLITDDAPVVQLVDLIVTQAFRDRASDVHIEPQGGRVRIRFRIDGALHDVLALPDSMGPALVSRIKIMADMNIVDRRRAQDGQAVMQIDGRPIDVRVSTSPNIWGEKAVLRLLDRTRTLYRLDELGMAADTHERFGKMMRSPYGMVICAGPTGSGKTTTLYSTLSEINQTERNITTIEDPVEYVFSSINQIQINDQAGLTFANGLRSILRQDPDVILVGEIRDAETARIAIESALTGHFVLSSIHATDACSALQRFVDMGIEPFLIASTVIGVVSQRLVRRICDQCRVAYEPSVEEMAFYDEIRARSNRPAEATPPTARRARAAGARHGETRYFRGRGCAFCSQTGYLDRRGVFELLVLNDEIKKMVVAAAPLEDLRAAAARNGMRSLVEEGLALVDEQLTTIPEIMRSIYVL